MLTRPWSDSRPTMAVQHFAETLMEETTFFLALVVMAGWDSLTESCSAADAPSGLFAVCDGIPRDPLVCGK